MQSAGPRQRVRRGETVANLSADVPVALHRAVRIKAAEDGVSITDVVQAALHQYLELGGDDATGAA